jgi:hypothetical protein
MNEWILLAHFSVTVMLVKTFLARSFTQQTACSTQVDSRRLSPLRTGFDPRSDVGFVVNKEAMKVSLRVV